MDGQWYSYDDSSVETVPEAEVCTRGAYILFYQRRNTIPPWSASSSLTGSTSSSTSDHWLVRLTGGSERDSLVSGGPSPGLPPVSTAAPESPELPVFGDEPVSTAQTNGFDTKPFVRGTQGRSVSMRSPTKPKETLSKVLPLRWSFTSKDRLKPSAQTQPQPGELVEYLESGRRPRCTKEPIVALVATPPLARTFEPRHNSPSGSIISTNWPGMDSPKIPEGQRIPESGLNNGRLRSSKMVRPDQGRNMDFQLPKGVFWDSALSHSAPPSRDSTLRRSRTQNGNTSRAHKDLLHMVLDPEDKVGHRGQEGRSHESLLSFFRPGFMKKDILRSPMRNQDRRLNGGKVASSDLSKLSLSNATLSISDRKTIPNGRLQLVNDRAALEDPANLKHAHSSSNLHTKQDLTFHRCASLQRNGDIMVPPTQHIQVSDKNGYGTLQRTRYSTTSLVPL